ncbi:hypothetical protein [Hydrogenophaga laconesensis]|uniref:Response receiver domain-containing protein n=1 Tax=Hydrogenophaga laconesensis TaxID=1805971 RepID=A0ABU1V8B5_9BURK|nr:hypothetical protein [Hydrogenophaga laconesensis]MDR7093605.1 hypothetical protein [Hydrogenophaga laconesensis]
MKPVEALELLGSKRVIWIDDRFATASPEKLIELLIAHAEDAGGVSPEPIQQALNKVVGGDDTGNHELEQAVANLTEAERVSLLRKVQLRLEDNGAEDLSDGQIDSVCAHLHIAKEDRWPFENSEVAMLELCKGGGDAEISYIIDLNDVQGADGNTRGLDLLKTLHGAGSKATALLLTHYATKTNEAEKELELRNLLLQDGSLDVSPVCVIAKDRLDPEGEAASTTEGRDATVAMALRIAIKRAGLRRNVHEVLTRVHRHIAQAFRNASNDLLEVPPEQLDEYVIGRAYAEGVSELHVVERALTASMSESFRHMFSVDQDTRENERRLRSLRGVPLGIDATVHHKKLEMFRAQEVWEREDLVNNGCSPLACGDVFEMDAQHDAPAYRFILLVQPCDIMLRPKGDRDSDAGFLVMLKQLENINDPSSQKQIRLPFLLGGKQWVCDLRKTTSVRLDLLDLVSYRADGRLEYHVDQAVPDCLLPGQQVLSASVFGSLNKAVKTRLNAGAALPKELKDARCQLTLATSGPFRYIAHGTFVEAKAATAIQPEVCAGFTWNLRRIGRVRMPYASAILGSYLAVVDRDAFDLDYLRPQTPKAPDMPVCGPCA